MSVLLSILIPTMPRRAHLLSRLRAELDPQLTDEVEVLIECDEAHNQGTIPTGTKRNWLVQKAKGSFVAHVDDDDLVARDYCSRILAAIKSDPTVDVIGIEGIMTVDENRHTAKRFIHSIRFPNWEERNGVHVRPANHISPIRRDLALQVPFKDIRFGEDRDFSDRIKPLLTRETMLQGGPVYLYCFVRRKNY